MGHSKCKFRRFDDYDFIDFELDFSNTEGMDVKRDSVGPKRKKESYRSSVAQPQMSNEYDSSDDENDDDDDDDDDAVKLSYWSIIEQHPRQRST